MTSACDVALLRARFARKHKRTIARNAPRIRALITSRNDCHVWTDRNSFSGMSTDMIKMLFSSTFVKKIHVKHKIVKVAVINDNNNFAPSIFRSLCEFVSDCFGPWHFFWGSAKNTSAQNNHLRFSHNDLQKRWCAVIIV